MQLRRAGLSTTSVITICCALNLGATLFKSAGATAAATGSLSISSSSYGAKQNLGVKLVTVNRTSGAKGPARVICKTVNDTAIAGLHFTAVTQILTWANGDTAPQNCHIPILNTTPFLGTRTFFVELSSPRGAKLGAITKSTVTIYGDQQNSSVALSSATYSVNQSGGSLTITVVRTGYEGGTASVGYATANGSAVAGKDYTAISGKFTWGYGDGASKTFAIPISNAVPFRGNKTLAVAIAGPAGTSMGTASAIVTIAGDGTPNTTPPVPADLSAVPGNGLVTLNWSAGNGTTSYHVKRATISGGPYAQVAAPASPSYIDSSVTNGTTYYYVVSALDSAGESGDSGQVSALPAAITSNSNPCGMLLNITPAIFCDTFDAPAGTGSRSGDLNGNVWGVSRTMGDTGLNFGQHAYNRWNATIIDKCDGTTPTVNAPRDVIICDGQVREATNDNNSGVFDAGDVLTLAMYPKQPFDFAGRTGTVSFDVSNDSAGTHAAWPEFWLSDLPVPAAFSHFSSWVALPANGFAVRMGATAPVGMAGDCPNDHDLTKARWTVDSVAAVRNYVLDDTNGYGVRTNMTMTLLDCVIASSGPGNMNHMEIRISQNQVDVYATDAGVAATSKTLKHIATVTNADLSFTKGLVWLEDVHYNADKETLMRGAPAYTSQRQHTFSWDNVAFDGPFTGRDFSYDALDDSVPGLNGSVNLGKFSPANQTSTWSVPNMPANPQAAAARVLFNFNGENKPNPTVLNVIVNGNVHRLPWPYPDRIEYSWRTLAVAIPLTDLVAGTNVVQLGANTDEVFSNVDIVLGDVAGGVPVLPGANDAYP